MSQATYVRSGVFLTAMLLLSQLALAEDVQNNIDWAKFLARHDLVFNHPPEKWGEGAFTGNGLLGAMVYLTDDKSALRFRIGRSDVMVKQNYRVPIGDLVLHPIGKITGGKFRLDLWNAEVTGTLTTDKGEIAIRTFTHASDLVQIIDLKPSDGERGCKWEFKPGICANPRTIRSKEPIPADEKSPEPVMDENSAVQKVFTGDEYATVWKEMTHDDSRTLFLSVGYSVGAESAKPQAQKAIDDAMTNGESNVEQSHRDWWHNFYQASFLSVPDTRLESFYWIQMYKLASATRADRPAIDLMGPWFNDTPWPRIWWNLNIQLTYYPVYASNHLELGESLCKMIDNGAENLAKNAKEFSADSDSIGRTSGYDCKSNASDEMCDLPWAMWNYYMQYRYSMDDAMLRDRLYPRLKRAMNYYFHHLKQGPDGKLHTTDGYSPEYPEQPKPNLDCNIDLGLIRWGCQALLDTTDRLKIDDPDRAKWKDTLANLTPYPTDENGLKISASVPFAQSHRHYSHLLMVFPLYVVNWDQPENHELITKSLDHWMSMPQAQRGYSYTGASSIAASIGRPDDAVKWLNHFIDDKGKYGAQPNTLYQEAGPVIETPLSAARSLQDIVLQSWGGTIRVFPGVPDSWKDVTIDRMRTEGAFVVSAVRRDGKTKWIRIESLAGEKCLLKCDIENPQADGVTMIKRDNGVIELGLKKGESVVVYPASGKGDMVVEPVAAQADRVNTFGLP
jgi:hypothetical protein